MVCGSRSCLWLAFAVSAALSAGCGGGDACDPIARTGCDEGLVCERVTGGESACFPPIVLVGQVFDLETQTPLADARVVAVDANRSPVSNVAISSIDGSYELSVRAERGEDGTPVDYQLTLRADRAGYLTFPSGIRQSLPVAISTAVVEDSRRLIDSVLTDIGLMAFANAPDGMISGTVEVADDSPGVLVVAESGGVGYTAIADTRGSYAIFNLAPGTYTVTPYSRGSNYAPAELEVVADHTVNFDIDSQATATVTGMVNIVEGGVPKLTSIIFVVESTFNETLGRGESPPGMRIPEGGVAPDVSGAFSLEGVPAGNYVILAAFENDLLVRDPNSCTAGTDFVHQTVGTDDIVLEEAFKVTKALEVISPGATTPDVVSATPTFTWVDDSGEDEYRLTVFDSFGTAVWNTTVPGVSGSDPEVVYAGPALESGMYYQFRVTSAALNGMNNCEIAQTEDLRGVFVVE